MARRALALGLLSGARVAAGTGDATVLVQASVKAHAGEGGQAAHGYSRQQLAQGLAQGQLPGLPGAEPFNCSKHPKMCQEPFNCQTFSQAEVLLAMTTGLARYGKANLRSWCIAPDYEDYIHTCIVKKDLVTAGEIQYNWTINKRDGIDELDGSYCFIEGHCSNTAVTNETTLEESYAMCDDRYGHDAWTKFGRTDLVLPYVLAQRNPKSASHTNGFHNPTLVKGFLMAACAMGNYHCDVMYCKATYCKKPHYIERYSHLLPKAPGHLIQQREWID